jgi:DNA-binding response OmpR family regulator
MAKDGATAWLVLMGEPTPELVVLDWNLPDTSGPEFCQRMRSKGITLPVLMLTGRDDVADRVAALDAGVDDYLIKPFSIDELLARIRALQRRLAPAAAPDELLELADLHVNLTSQSVRRGNSPLELSEKEYALLVHLLKGGGSAQPPAQLLAALWGEAFAEETALLEVYAESLAQKLDGQRADRLIHRQPDGSVALRAHRGAADG